MRYLLIKQAKHFFAYHLSCKHSFGLIGQRVIREKVRAVFGVLFKLREQSLYTLARFCADGNNRFKIILLRKSRNFRDKLFLTAYHIYFVKSCYNRHFCRAKFIYKLLFRGVKLFIRRIDDKQALFNARNTVVYRLNHIFAELVLRFKKSRSVGKNKLHIIIGSQNAHNFCTGGLRFTGYYGYFTAYKSVEYRRFADVCLADYGCKS